MDAARHYATATAPLLPLSTPLTLVAPPARPFAPGGACERGAACGRAGRGARGEDGEDGVDGGGGAKLPPRGSHGPARAARRSGRTEDRTVRGGSAAEAGTRARGRGRGGAPHRVDFHDGGDGDGAGAGGGGGDGGGGGGGGVVEDAGWKNGAGAVAEGAERATREILEAVRTLRRFGMVRAPRKPGGEGGRRGMGLGVPSFPPLRRGGAGRKMRVGFGGGGEAGGGGGVRAGARGLGQHGLAKGGR
jgi:hypothetical protein